MFHSLYQYLVLNQRLSLPGIGTIYINRASSQLDISNKIFSAPVYFFSLDHSGDKPSKKLFSWLAHTTGVSEWDAIRMVNDFSFDIKKKLAGYGEVKWENIGVIHRDDKGNIALDSLKYEIADVPVRAEKVMREHAQHPVLVGAMEKTSAEMEVMLAEEPVKKDYGWIIAIVLGILTLMFVGWYFSEKGISPSATGNQVKSGR